MKVVPIRKPSSAKAAPVLSDEKAAENASALDLYYGVTCRVRRLKTATIANQRRINERFLEFAKRAIWEITPSDYEKWIVSVLDSRPKEKPLAIATQRFYQSAVRAFFRSLAENQEYQNELIKKHGAGVTNPITAGNEVIHRNEDESEQRAFHLTHEETGQLFNGIKGFILAHKDARRTLITAQRDLFLYATQYYCGGRVSEIVALDTNSFESTLATEKLLGRFGAVRIKSKSSRGAPKKNRSTPIVSASFYPLAQWYLKNVRPQFVGAKNTKALFLGRPNKRLSRWSAMANLKKYLKASGLEQSKFSPHSLRRSTLTHVTDAVDLVLAQFIGGHVFASTTQGYVRLPPQALQNRLATIVRRTATRSSATKRRQVE